MKTQAKTTPAPAGKTEVKPTTDIMRKDQGQVPASFDPSIYVGDAGKGQEGVQSDDIAIPFIYVLQSNSPQVKRSDAKYIKGAEEGDLMNSVTSEILPNPLRIIPCFFDKNLIEWKPRAQGGGLVARYQRTDPIAKRAIRGDQGPPQLPNGNDLIETANHYVVVPLQEGVPQAFWAVLSMSSTKLKVSRKFNNLVANRMIHIGEKMVAAPTFAFSYLLGTVAEANAKGSFFNFTLEVPEDKVPHEWMKGLVTDANLYKNAKFFYERVKSGMVKVADPIQEEVTGDGYPGMGGEGLGDEGDDIM
jgi:hypothetical protein